MRLNEDERNCIIKSVHKNFETAAKIILFGSRMNDAEKGGDIDLLIETNEQDAYIKRIKTVTDIQLQIGEQRIDILTAAGSDDKRLIIKNAYKQGIVLWEKPTQ